MEAKEENGTNWFLSKKNVVKNEFYICCVDCRVYAKSNESHLALFASEMDDMSCI